MKRTIYITVRRKHKLEETQVIQARQKIVITVRKKGQTHTIKNKEALTPQQIDLEDFKNPEKSIQPSWDRQIRI